MPGVVDAKEPIEARYDGVVGSQHYVVIPKLGINQRWPISGVDSQVPPAAGATVLVAYADTGQLWLVQGGGDYASQAELNTEAAARVAAEAALDARLDALESRYHVKVRPSSAQNITDQATGGWQIVTWGTQIYDLPNNDQWSSGDALTVRKVGLYRVSASVAFGANATGARGMRLTINGTVSADQILMQTVGAATIPFRGQVVGSERLAVNDLVRLEVWQNSTATLALDQTLTWIAMEHGSD